MIHYVGPLDDERHLKLDLADNELIVETTERPVIVRYRDQPNDAIALRTYTLEEVTSEK